VKADNSELNGSIHSREFNVREKMMDNKFGITFDYAYIS
jgi:hypothetical protein